MGIMYTGMFASIYITPLFLQTVQGVTPWNTGLTVMPMALVMAVLNPISGRLFDKLGARWLVMVGLLINGLANLWMSQLDVTTSRPEIIVRLMVSGVGLSMSFMPIMAGGMSVLPPEIVSGGSAITTLVQRVTAALGLAAITALTSVQQAQLFVYRNALTQPSGADVDPRITAMQGGGSGGLLPIFTELRHQVTTQSYSNAFFLVGVCVLASVPLAYLLPSRREGSGASAPIDAH
jgi:nitrate/nitrite transporter NarK